MHQLPKYKTMSKSEFTRRMKKFGSEPRSINSFWKQYKKDELKKERKFLKKCEKFNEYVGRKLDQISKRMMALQHSR
jgi:hypothetical protein